MAASLQQAAAATVSRAASHNPSAPVSLAFKCNATLRPERSSVRALKQQASQRRGVSLRAVRPGYVCAAAVRWVLEPIGDGDCSHLDETVAKPEAITLEADAFVIGRVADRSDVVINIPTVSGSHARIEKKGDELVVTDLNSTNGTFLNELRLRPGTPTSVPSGSVVTFGDQHLAMFRAVQSIEAVDV